MGGIDRQTIWLAVHPATQRTASRQKSPVDRRKRVLTALNSPGPSFSARHTGPWNWMSDDRRRAVFVMSRRHFASDAPGRAGSLQNCWMGFKSSRSCRLPTWLDQERRPPCKRNHAGANPVVGSSRTAKRRSMFIQRATESMLRSVFTSAGT